MFILSGFKAIEVKVSKSEISMIVGFPSSSVYVKVPSLFATMVVKVSNFLITSSKSILVISPSSSIYSNVFPSTLSPRKVRVSKSAISII